MGDKLGDFIKKIDGGMKSLPNRYMCSRLCKCTPAIGVAVLKKYPTNAAVNKFMRTRNNVATTSAYELLYFNGLITNFTQCSAAVKTALTTSTNTYATKLKGFFPDEKLLDLINKLE